MKLIVDRIEGNIAVCMDENEVLFELEISALPDGVREGSVLLQLENGCFEPDLKAEEERREMLFDLQNDLFDE